MRQSRHSKTFSAQSKPNTKRKLADAAIANATALEKMTMTAQTMTMTAQSMMAQSMTAQSMTAQLTMAQSMTAQSMMAQTEFSSYEDMHNMHIATMPITALLCFANALAKTRPTYSVQPIYRRC